MPSLVKLLFLVVLAIVAQRVYQTISFMKFGHVVYNHTPGPCKLVDGIDHGSEDIQVLPNGLAFFSSGLRFMNPTGEFFENSKGRIYLFDFNNPEKSPELLHIPGKDFHEDIFNPHGISVWTDPDGVVFVYVVNHAPSQERVDYFRFDDKSQTLVHEGSVVADSNFGLLNDLVVIGHRQFYYTNYLHVPHKIETFARLYWGSIGFYDGESTSIVDDHLLMPNGINVSPDHKFVYLSHIGETEVRVYNRHPNNSISLKKSYQVHTITDNLDVDETTGDIWTGCHPVPYKTISALEDPANHYSPSQVLKLKMKDGEVESVTELYVDDGAMLSASTVAVHYKDAMLIGTVCDKLMYCQITYQ